MSLAHIITIISFALFAVLLTLYSRLYIHILQQDGYKNMAMLKWCIANFSKYLSAPLGIFVVFGSCSLAFFMKEVGDMAISIFIAICALSTIALIITGRIKNAKKPLSITARVKRILAGVFVIYAALLALSFLFLKDVMPAMIIAASAMAILAPIVVAISNIMLAPIENMIKKWYFNDAKKKLAANKDMIKIGITGSYGKTSTKFIMSEMLSEKFSVLTPPQSFNTPMGLTRTIREQLDDQQVFVAEMGARHVGDIKELCGLVYPKYGIITSVGPQHIETFKSVENVAKTKYELIESLPSDGIAFFNADSEPLLELYEKTKIEKVLFGIDYSGDLYAKAQDIKTGSFGSEFSLKFADEEEAILVTTKLLGKHNIINIVGCAAVAKKIGMSLEEIKNGIAKVTPVEHRLCLIPSGNGINVIDDAFNSNPKGAKCAMEVLKSFPGRHIVITPGMVELGEMEKELHEQFGADIADAADIAILVGEKRTASIYDGIIKSGFDMNNVYVTKTLDEAMAIFAKISRVGDTVIFENDLPDSMS